MFRFWASNRVPRSLAFFAIFIFRSCCCSLKSFSVFFLIHDVLCVFGAVVTPMLDMTNPGSIPVRTCFFMEIFEYFRLSCLLIFFGEGPALRISLFHVIFP